MYKIHYLPLALDDLKEIVRYIAHELEAPRAAENLILKIDKEVQKTADNPYRCHLFVSPEKLKYEYRILNVNIYFLFYVVEPTAEGAGRGSPPKKGKIEIHRVIYSKRNIISILKGQE